jgi:hypothetical protein
MTQTLVRAGELSPSTAAVPAVTGQRHGHDEAIGRFRSGLVVEIGARCALIC